MKVLGVEVSLDEVGQWALISAKPLGEITTLGSLTTAMIAQIYAIKRGLVPPYVHDELIKKVDGFSNVVAERDSLDSSKVHKNSRLKKTIP